jgi:hypothetical protein
MIGKSRLLELCISGTLDPGMAAWACGLKRSTWCRQAGKAARGFHLIFEMGDIIIHPGKMRWFAIHSIRVLGKSIAYKSGSNYHIRAFHFFVLRYKVCARTSAEENWFTRCFPAGMSVQ